MFKQILGIGNKTEKTLEIVLLSYLSLKRRGQESVRVIYCVEKTHNNEIVYLQRPAYLNKGFDFTVNVKTYKFKAPTEKNPKRETKTPRHDSVYLELQAINKKTKS